MSDTKVPFPNPTLHAGQRLVVSGYARAQVADYGDKRAAERDSFWQSEAGNAAPTQGAEGAAPQAVVGEASEGLWQTVRDVLGFFRLTYWCDADGEGLPLVDHLCRPKARDISDGASELNMLCDDIVAAVSALTPSPTLTAPQEADALREALKGTVAAIESMYGRKPEHVEAALANAKHALLATRS